MHYGKVKIVDISESVVSQYLEIQHKLTRTRLTDVPLYLSLEPNNPALAEALITSQRFSGDTTDMFLMMACLSLFESDERIFIVFKWMFIQYKCQSQGDNSDRYISKLDAWCDCVTPAYE
ncbi:putative envelope protein [Escherichia coli 99.0815]|nr:putative envelope protein [Escherichia coli 99.0815]